MMMIGSPFRKVSKLRRAITEEPTMPEIDSGYRGNWRWSCVSS